MLTAFGVAALTFMMIMYALEPRGAGFVLAFACGCALASVYGFLAGTWPFGLVELIWSGISVRRYVRFRREGRHAGRRAAGLSGTRWRLFHLVGGSYAAATGARENPRHEDSVYQLHDPPDR